MGRGSMSTFPFIEHRTIAEVRRAAVREARCGIVCVPWPPGLWEKFAQHVRSGLQITEFAKISGKSSKALSNYWHDHASDEDKAARAAALAAKRVAKPPRQKSRESLDRFNERRREWRAERKAQGILEREQFWTGDVLATLIRRGMAGESFEAIAKDYKRPIKSIEGAWGRHATNEHKDSRRRAIAARPSRAKLTTISAPGSVRYGGAVGKTPKKMNLAHNAFRDDPRAAKDSGSWRRPLWA